MLKSLCVSSGCCRLFQQKNETKSCPPVTFPGLERHNNCFCPCRNTQSLPFQSAHENMPYSMYYSNHPYQRAVFILSCWDDRGSALGGTSSQRGSLLPNQTIGILVLQEPKTAGLCFTDNISPLSVVGCWCLSKLWTKGRCQTQPWLHGQQCLLCSRRMLSGN